MDCSFKRQKSVTIVSKLFIYSLFFSNKRKPNKIRVDQGSEVYSTHNEGKSVVAEIFIRTLKTKIYKNMTSVLKNVYIHKLNDMVNEYNNRYHRSIKIKPVDVKDNTYINCSKEVNDKDPKFQVGDYVRVSK